MGTPINYFVVMVKPNTQELLARGPWEFETAKSFRDEMENLAAIYNQSHLAFCLIPNIEIGEVIIHGRN